MNRLNRLVGVQYIVVVREKYVFPLQTGGDRQNDIAVSRSRCEEQLMADRKINLFERPDIFSKVASLGK